MKKTWTLFTSAALLLSIGFSMTACNKNADKLVDSYSINRSASLKKDVLQGTSGTYQFIEHDEAGHVVVKETHTNNNTFTTYSQYKILDLKSGTLISNVNDENEIKVLDKGLFYSVKTQNSVGVPLEAPLYTLYGTNGKLVSDVKGKTQNGIFHQEDGTRWYVDYNGSVSKETDPFAMLFTDYDYQVGDFYITLDNQIMYVYNEDGNFERALNLAQELELTESDEIISYWYTEDRLFAQVVTELPEDAKKYDFVEDDGNELQKYKLNTYSYSLKRDKVKKVKGFDYIVEGTAYSNQESTILYVREIKDKNVSQNEIIQSFGKNGKVNFDIQKMVPGACDVERNGDYVIFEDNAEFMHIYKEKDCILSLPEANASFNFLDDTTKAYYMVGDTLYIYDIESQYVVKSVADVENYGMTRNGNLYYKVSNNGQDQYTVYNARTGREETTNFGDYVNLTGGGFGNAYYITSSSSAITGTTSYSIVFPDSNLASISDVLGAGYTDSYSTSYRSSGSYSSTSYTILYTTQKNMNTGDTIYNYHIVSNTYSREVAEK